MAFIKTNWTETTAITAERLNHMEKQYDEAVKEIGVGAGSAINNHVNVPAPHTGHVKGTMTITAAVVAPTNPVNGDIWIKI